MKKFALALCIILSISLFAACSGSNPSEDQYKEAQKQAEEMKKLTLKEKFDKLQPGVTMLETRAQLGAPEVERQGKLGEQTVTIYIWKDTDGSEYGVSFVGAKMTEKLDKEQIEYFKKNS